jgi:signal transduction histidine kinase
MEAHGGRVEVEAKTGVGTRVSLIFPASRVP